MTWQAMLFAYFLGLFYVKRGILSVKSVQSLYSADRKVLTAPSQTPPPLSALIFGRLEPTFSCLIVFFSFDILWEWMRMQTTSKSFVNLLLRAGDVHLGGHVLPGWGPSKVISLAWIWSWMNPENWLRIDLSGDWYLCIVPHTCTGACYYWIGTVLLG